MSDQETPPPETAAQTAPKSPSFVAEVFSQANITTALAVFAVILAGAPYVVPQLQAYQVRNGLLHTPDIVAEASTAYQQQQLARQAQAATVRVRAYHDSIFNDRNDPVINPSGKIKVVEFLDYQCAYCRAATPVIQDFLKSNPDVQLVVKEYPVVHPDNSIALAAYAIQAYRAGKYEAVHYGFLNHNFHPEKTGYNIAPEVNAIVAQAGLDPAALKSGMNDPAILDQINKTQELGSNLGINGTPTFIIGDQEIEGARIDQLQAAVDAARAGK